MVVTKQQSVKEQIILEGGKSAIRTVKEKGAGINQYGSRNNFHYLISYQLPQIPLHLI